MAKKADILKKQTFRIDFPGADRVLLVGSFTQWQKKGIPMKKGKDGIWTTSVELPAGQHNYRFIVDGAWTDDPECSLRISNPHGSQDMVRVVA
jgi:1,4-alpha-glucan branching enzyme